MRRYRKQVAAVGIALAVVSGPPPTQAGSVSRLEVEHDRGRYRIAADLVVDASPTAVRAVLTDYAALPRLNRSIRRSRIVASPTPSQVRVSTVIEACMLAICRTLNRVEDIRERDQHLVAEIVPELSNFRYGRTEWRFRRQAGQSVVEYRAEVEPDFSVPPFLGPALIKLGLERELKSVLESLKHYAEAD